MSNRGIFTALLLSSTLVWAQSGKAASTVPLQSPSTLPIVFTNTVSASRSHVGDPVTARTNQTVLLPNGASIPSGTKITGHVVSAVPFVYDKTPYAQQKQSVLSIRFDSLQVGGELLPLNVTVRAIADPITSWGARTPNVNNVDSSLHTATQIGGDQLTPSQSEVISSQGDVVGYNRHGGVYAHLIANRGCDASSVEVSVGIYSASACGLYGFADVTAQQVGSVAIPSTLTLLSTHTAPKLWKNSTALLEVLPNQQTLAAR